MTPQRCNRKRGLFGKKEPSDEGSHLEGKATHPLSLKIAIPEIKKIAAFISLSLSPPPVVFILIFCTSFQVLQEGEGEGAKPIATCENTQVL